MKTVFIISDTHGNRSPFDGLAPVLSECDYIIHLGDTSADGNILYGLHPNKTHLINGNCDPIKLGADELVIKIENVNVFATHGHLYSAKSTLKKLAARANELGCTVALYGHTHSPREDVIDGVTLINPGSFTRYGTKSYCYGVINGDKAVFKHVFLN